MLKIYTYKGCSTCRKALKWLENRRISFQEIPIREKPPSMEELQAMLIAKRRGLLFNTSGQDYRTLNLRNKLPGMSDIEAVKLLSENGNLIKRPFALDEKKGIFLLGFKENEWAAAF